MISLLIVDDQDVVRQGLIKMIGELDLGVDNIYEASDGEEALKLVGENSPDIIFADIMMPRLDGLQLIENLKKSGCSSQIVIISAYNDFDFTRKAINYKVEDYLLKPVVKNDLYNLLMVLKGKIGDDKERLKKVKEQEFKYYFRLLYDYLTGQDVLTNIKDIFAGTGINFLHPFFTIAVLQDGNEKGDVNEDIRQSLNEQLRASGVVLISFCSEAGKLVYILNIKAPEDAIGISMITNFVNESKLKLRCGISETMEGLQSLRRIFGQADIALKESMFRCVKMCRFSEIKKESQSLISMSDQMKLLDLFSRGRKSELDRMLDDIFFRLTSAMPNVNNAFNALFNLLDSLYINLVPHYPGICDMEPVKRKLAAAGSFFRMKVVVQETINDMSEKFAEFNKSDYSNHIVNYIVNIVKNNFQEKISLYRIAEELSMNYNYVSGLFAKKAGMTFQEYLIRFRLEKAKELLTSGDCKMDEVSEKSGFYDSKHFCKAFKKRFDMTPREYREKFRYISCDNDVTRNNSFRLP